MKKPVADLLRSDMNVQECDATIADSSKKDDIIK